MLEEISNFVMLISSMTAKFAMIEMMVLQQFLQDYYEASSSEVVSSNLTILYFVLLTLVVVAFVIGSRFYKFYSLFINAGLVLSVITTFILRMNKSGCPGNLKPSATDIMQMAHTPEYLEGKLKEGVECLSKNMKNAEAVNKHIHTLLADIFNYWFISAVGDENPNTQETACKFKMWDSNLLVNFIISSFRKFFNVKLKPIYAIYILSIIISNILSFFIGVLKTAVMLISIPFILNYLDEISMMSKEERKSALVMLVVVILGIIAVAILLKFLKKLFVCFVIAIYASNALVLFMQYFSTTGENATIQILTPWGKRINYFWGNLKDELILNSKSYKLYSEMPLDSWNTWIPAALFVSSLLLNFFFKY